MKPEEECARGFLKRRFGLEPVYEPLGKYSPPDFSIKKTAFEVRRLNQRYFYQDGTIEGLEQVEYPIRKAVHAALAKIPFSKDRGSLSWDLNFRRPLLGEPRSLAAQLAAAVRDHYVQGSRQSRKFVAGNVTLDLMQDNNPDGKAFTMGCEGDDDSGGFLGDIYPVSIRLALEEKIAKTKSIAKKFDRWGLILVDFIFPGVTSPSDIGPLDLKLEHFATLAIINPDGSLALEWPEHSLRLC